MSGELLRQWGENIKMFRKARGLTQQQLADLIDVRGASVSRWEAGKAAPRDHHKVALAEVLDVDVRTLFPLVRGSK